MGLSALGSWYRHNVGSESDYTPRDSFVNKVRSNGMGPAMVGAGLGATAGAAGGYALGYSHLAADKLSVTTQTYDVLKPVLLGAHYHPEDSTYIAPTYDSDGHQTGDGYWQDDPAYWSSLVDHQKTGQTYTRQEIVHSSTAWGPIPTALVGLAGGAVVGLLCGSIAQAILHGTSGQDSVPQTETSRKVARAADHAPLAGTVAGTAVGAAVGMAAGRLAEARNLVLTQTYQKPDFQTQTIGYLPTVSQHGQIPSQYFHGRDLNYKDLPDGMFGTPHFAGSKAVQDSVPTGTFTPTTITERGFSMTPLTGALLGAGAGAATGFLSGVAAGVVMKALAGESPPPEY